MTRKRTRTTAAAGMNVPLVDGGGEQQPAAKKSTRTRAPSRRLENELVVQPTPRVVQQMPSVEQHPSILPSNLSQPQPPVTSVVREREATSSSLGRRQPNDHSPSCSPKTRSEIRLSQMNNDYHQARRRMLKLKKKTIRCRVIKIN